MSSSRLVRVLYRSLLESTEQLQYDLEHGHTLFNAIRSGVTASYPGVKLDWQRERRYENRLNDMMVVQQWNRRPAFASLVRSGFEQPLDLSNKAAINARIDAAFNTLHDVDDQNAMIRNLVDAGAFKPRRRTDEVKFHVGDIVEVRDEGLGVIYGWSVARTHAFADLHVVYDVLPHHHDQRRLHRVSQENIQLAADPQPIQHPSLLLHFDGFENGRHIPSAPLARLFPEDAASNATTGMTGYNAADEEVVYAPSIVQLQFADEAKLVRCLGCKDRTIAQFALAALEGRWLGDCDESTQANVRMAMEMVDAGETEKAREVLQQVVQQSPDYAYAWSKLGMVEFRLGNIEQAMAYYEEALARKPQLMDALTGLGTCATKLQHWDVAHRAALQLLNVQPNNETARLLLENAIYASL